MSANGDNKRPFLPVPKREADISDKWTPRWSADGNALCLMTACGKTSMINAVLPL